MIGECVLLLRLVYFLHTKPRDWLGERLRNDLFCVEWDVKPQLNQSNRICVEFRGLDDDLRHFDLFFTARRCHFFSIADCSVERPRNLGAAHCEKQGDTKTKRERK